MPSTNIEELENQLRDAKEIIARRDQVTKLKSNREFRKLILEDYCVTEAARLVGLSADPAINIPMRADALNMAQASGHLLRYLRVLEQMAAVAERDIVDVGNMLDELRGETADAENGAFTDVGAE